MTIVWALWEILINFIETFFLFYYLSAQLGYSPDKNRRIYTFALVIIACVTALNLIGVHYNITMILMFLIKVTYALMFNGSIGKRLFLGVIGGSIPIFANMLISVLLTWTSGIDISETLLPSESRFAITILYSMIVASAYWIASRVRRKQNIRFPLFSQILMVGVMLLGIFAACGAISLSITSARTTPEQIVLSAISAAILAMMVAIILLFDKIGRTLWEKIYIEGQLKQAHLEEEHNQRTEAMIRAWRHDFHNYLEVLRIYIENKDYDQLKNYVGEVEQEFQSTLSLFATGVSSIDAVLASKMLIANENSVKVYLDVARLPRLTISETKLCVLLGNLLDNAIEACEKISDAAQRYIKLSIFPQRGMLMIHIVNRAPNDYSYQDDHLISSKKESNHGYGLARVKQIVEAENGLYSFTHTEKEFDSALFLPLREDSSEN